MQTLQWTRAEPRDNTVRYDEHGFSNPKDYEWMEFDSDLHVSLEYDPSDLRLRVYVDNRVMLNEHGKPVNLIAEPINGIKIVDIASAQRAREHMLRVAQNFRRFFNDK